MTAIDKDKFKNEFCDTYYKIFVKCNTTENKKLNHRRFEMGHSVSPISNFEVDPSEDVTGRVPLQIFKGIKEKCIIVEEFLKKSWIDLYLDCKKK
jgi:hypothetical protein